LLQQYRNNSLQITGKFCDNNAKMFCPRVANVKNNFKNKIYYQKMGLGEKKTKSDKRRRGNRAGLHFPVHFVRRFLKVAFPTKKFQKHTDVAVTAHCEYPCTELLLKAADNVVKGQHITTEHIYKVLNDPETNLAGVFPKNVSGLHF